MGLLSKDNEHKFGTCQWCEKHNVALTFIIGHNHGKLWSGWVCNECLGVRQKEECGDKHEHDELR